MHRCAVWVLNNFVNGKNGRLKNGIAWNLACENFRCNLDRLVAIHPLCVRNIHEDMSGKDCGDIYT